MDSKQVCSDLSSRVKTMLNANNQMQLIMFRTIKNGFFFLKEINIFIQQGCIKLIKIDSEDIYNITKELNSNKCCSFELSYSS